MAEMNRMEISVGQDGTADFNTITEAINTIPLYNNRRVLIRINSGVYREKVNIPRTMRFITFVGNGSDPPTITGNDTASTVSGRDGHRSGHFKVPLSPLMQIILSPSTSILRTRPHMWWGQWGNKRWRCGYRGRRPLFITAVSTVVKTPYTITRAFTILVIASSRAPLISYFGYGTSLYEKCYLNSVSKKVASVTAQKRSNSSISSGFSFKNCTLTGSAGGSIYLGRAWGDYSRVIFSYTFMDKIVLPQGWSDWGKQSRDQKVYYGEYKCSGAGANLTGRVPWARALTDQEAMPFIGTYYIDGDTWLMDSSLYHF
ncbi:putative pectinesterase 53 [Sesamum angolense]|uniref:pectinesterase n=1 Tax=Sesamum angolense TaxID=2727404 RepID=A0AAE1X8P5_9LAMI|nr:putative pectinesterase 53 [Sesamum angolense]